MMPSVCHLVLSLAPGGLERLVVDWTNERNRKEPSSTCIVCLDEAGGLADQVDGMPAPGGGRRPVSCVNACRSRRPFDVAAVYRLRRMLRDQSVRILHSHNTAAWQYGAIACLGTGVCHVHTEHGTNPHSGGLVNRIRSVLLLRMTCRTVAVSVSVAEELVTRHRIPRNVIDVVTNGIQCGRFPESQCAGKSMSEDDPGAQGFCVGSVGRLAKVKGHDRLLSAFREFQRLGAGGRGVRPRLLLVGDGPERMALERQAHALGIADSVTFAGYQPDPRCFLSGMDVFVLPSRSEGLSVSLLEAMASGVPVAVTDAGENRRIIDDGRCGVVLPQDESQWPAILAELLQDSTRRKAFAEAARLRVREFYSIEATMTGYENIYASCSGIV